MLEQEILVIQESLEDYVQSWANKEEIGVINQKWKEIKDAIKNNLKLNQYSVIYFALMSYCEEAISSEHDRINLIDAAWLKIRNKIM